MCVYKYSYMENPSVQIQELDKRYYVPFKTSEIACYVGHFERGPINVPIYITDVNQFKFLFGRGIDQHRNDWYQVYNFLQYSSGIYVVRSCGSINYNATSDAITDDVYINRYSDWLIQRDTLSATSAAVVKFIARTPGNWGNSISVSTILKNSWDNNVHLGFNKYSKEIFEYFEEGYIGICIFKSDSLVETFYKKFEEFNDLNTESLYIYVLTGTYDSNNVEYYDTSILNLSNGFNSYPTRADLQETYSLLENPDEYNIDIIIGNQIDNQLAIDLAEKRKDCIAFIGLPSSIQTFLSVIVNSEEFILNTEFGDPILLEEYNFPSNITDVTFTIIKNYVNSLMNSEFVHFSCNIKVQYDHFLNTKNLVNIAGDAAGLKAQASKIAPWIPSAGLERGLIKNIERVHFKYSQSQKEILYKMGINIIENNFLMSQKTFLNINSSFSNIHTRSLFNHIEKEIKYALRNFIFTENTIGLRRSVATSLKLYLENVKINKGIDAASIYVEPYLETGILIQIIIKPKYVTEKIILKMINSGQNEFTTIIS